MDTSLRHQLLREQVVTEQQLQEAEARQRLHGEGLVPNLVALGHATPERLHAFIKKTYAAPKTVEDTGLELSFIADLTLKHILFMGEFILSDVAQSIRLSIAVVESAIEHLRREKLVEVKGASQFVKSSFKFAITGQGKNRAGELFDICRYSGPAPVPLDSYKKMIELQTIKNIPVDREGVERAFSHLTLNKNLVNRLGPALSSGRPIFIYGPSGNGKTAIAEAIGRALPGTIFMPYSIIVGGQIISVFDSVNHIPDGAEPGDADLDQRWIRVRRPAVMTGGELTLSMLDLQFNSIAKYYEAPLHMKANNGIFIIDDFGRQQMDPQSLLDRWIVNLDRNVDFMSLHTGMKFDIPFHQLVIFSTNIEPKTLMDEAFLRRIRYKIKIDHPSEKEFETIFRRVCEKSGIEFNKYAFNYLLESYYKRFGVKLSACHPRDLIDQITEEAHFLNNAPQLTEAALNYAWENYFLEK